MQRSIYMTDDTFDKLKKLAGDRAYSEIIRELINKAYQDGNYDPRDLQELNKKKEG